MIHEHERVVLTNPIPEHGLQVDHIGTVVHIYPRHEAYEVEFVTLTGETAAVVTVTPDQIRTAGRGEISHARALIRS